MGVYFRFPTPASHLLSASTISTALEYKCEVFVLHFSQREMFEISDSCGGLLGNFTHFFFCCMQNKEKLVKCTVFFLELKNKLPNSVYTDTTVTTLKMNY